MYIIIVFRFTFLSKYIQFSIVKAVHAFRILFSTSIVDTPSSEVHVMQCFGTFSFSELFATGVCTYNFCFSVFAGKFTFKTLLAMKF